MKRREFMGLLRQAVENRNTKHCRGLEVAWSFL